MRDNTEKLIMLKEKISIIEASLVEMRKELDFLIEDAKVPSIRAKSEYSFQPNN